MLLFYKMLRVVTLKCLTKEYVHDRKFVVHGVICTFTKGPISLAETSPRLISCGNLGDSGDQKMACALKSHQGDVAATAETDQSRRLGRPKHGLRSHVAETSPRPAGDWKSLQKNWTCLNFLRLPGDLASLQETSRRLKSPPSLQASEIRP